MARSRRPKFCSKKISRFEPHADIMSGEQCTKPFQSFIRSQIRLLVTLDWPDCRKHWKTLRRTKLSRALERGWGSTWRLVKDILSIFMRPSSLGGGRIMRRTLSVRLSVCPSVPLSLPSVTSRHLANYNDTHVLFGTRWGQHIVRPSRPHRVLL